MRKNSGITAKPALIEMTCLSFMIDCAKVDPVARKRIKARKQPVFNLVSPEPGRQGRLPLHSAPGYRVGACLQAIQDSVLQPPTSIPQLHRSTFRPNP